MYLRTTTRASSLRRAMCRLCVFGCSQSHRSSDTGCCSRTHQNPYLLDTPCSYLKKKEGVVAAVTRGTTQPSLQHARSPTSSTFHRSRGLLDGLLRRSPKGSTQSHPRCLRTNVPLSVGPAWGSEIGGLMRHDQLFVRTRRSRVPRHVLQLICTISTSRRSSRHRSFRMLLGRNTMAPRLHSSGNAVPFRSGQVVDCSASASRRCWL